MKWKTTGSALLVIAFLMMVWMAAPASAKGRCSGGGRGWGGGGNRCRTWRPPNCNRNNRPIHRNFNRRSTNLSIGVGLGGGYGGGYWDGGWYGGSTQWIPNNGSAWMHSGGYTSGFTGGFTTSTTYIEEGCGCPLPRHYTTCAYYEEPVCKTRTATRQRASRKTAERPINIKVNVINSGNNNRRTSVERDGEDEDDDVVYDSDDDADDRDTSGSYWSNRVKQHRK